METINIYLCSLGMERLLKYIMIVMLVSAAYNRANDVSAGIESEENTCSVPYTLAEPQAFSSHELPFLPEAELGGIGISACQNTDSRALRIIANLHQAALKSITRNISERQALLTKHWRKLCDYSVSSSYPVCEYYIFALRHIII